VLRCQKCGVRTKNINFKKDTRGKSAGKSREIIRAECEKRGSNLVILKIYLQKIMFKIEKAL